MTGQVPKTREKPPTLNSEIGRPVSFDRCPRLANTAKPAIKANKESQEAMTQQFKVTGESRGQ
jgi:hypothetical protein